MCLEPKNYKNMYYVFLSKLVTCHMSHICMSRRCRLELVRGRIEQQMHQIFPIQPDRIRPCAWTANVIKSLGIASYSSYSLDCPGQRDAFAL